MLHKHIFPWEDHMTDYEVVNTAKTVVFMSDD